MKFEGSARPLNYGEVKPGVPPDREEKKAQALLMKIERDNDALEAMKDYRAERKRILANTARLRAERLARNAAAPTVKEPASKGQKKQSISSLKKVNKPQLSGL